MRLRLGRSGLNRAGSVVLGVALVAGLTMGAVRRHPAASSAQVNLGSGSAWFPLPNVGRVALIDGTTVTKVAEVTVANPGEMIGVVQAGSGAYVVNRSKGTARAVDGATFNVSGSAPLGSAADAHLAVASTATVTWALERDGEQAQQLDPKTLTLFGGPLSFPGPASEPVISADGTLWLANGGLVRSFRGGRQRSEATVAGIEQSRLVLAAGRPVLIDVAHQQAIVFNPATGSPGRSLCFDLPENGAEVAGSTSSSPWALAVGPHTGT